MGTLARPHGIKGEICVDWYADSPSLLDGPFWLQAGDAPPRPARARSWRMHKGRPLLLLEGVTDRNDIEALRGQKILVDRDLLPPVDEDEVYVEDVLGFAVILPDGSRLGVLDHVEYPAGLEVWSIVTDDGKGNLVANVTWPNGTPPTFKNTYTKPVPAVTPGTPGKPPVRFAKTGDETMSIACVATLAILAAGAVGAAAFGALRKREKGDERQ